MTKKSGKKEAVVQPGEFNSQRARLVYGAFMVVFAVLAGRSIWLQIFPPSPKNLTNIATKQYQNEIALSPYRGTIFDRRGDPLAISIRKPSLFVNPRVFAPTRGEKKKLSHILKISRTNIEKIAKRKNYFAWLKRKVDQKTLTKVEALGIDGLYHTAEPARFYPGSKAASNLIGYVNIDDVGMAGLEQQYNSVLQGASSKLSSRKDARGHLIFHEIDEARPEEPGRNIKLTIDRAIQDIAMAALVEGVKNADAKAGMAVVADPHTGRILAIANAPTFNPNSRNIFVKNTRNRVLQDGFEPGSVMKSFVIAEALEKNIVTPDSKLDCENGSYQAGGVTFRDSHKPETRFLSVRDTFISSSNVCTYKIAEKLSARGLFDVYTRLGFGTRQTDIDYPAQAFGYLSPWQKWKPIRFANLAFGQGLLTTSLEVVQALGAIANGGQLMQPLLIDSVESTTGRWKHFPSKRLATVYSAKTTELMRDMMFDLVEEGAIKAKMTQFSAGGKTGTSQKIDPKTKSYSRKKYWAIFGGITPIHDPHLVILVVIDEPNKTLHYGSLWAAPVFKEIAEKSLSYLNVPPDKLLAKSAEEKRVY